LWINARIIRSIKNGSDRFIGLRAARMGFAASAVVTVLIATLIGITIPVRLERRQWAIEAAANVPAYTIARAMLEYRELHGTLPLVDNDKVPSELRTLPDPDGSIADALRYFDPNGYQVGTVLAAASTKSKSLVSRGSAIRNASTTAAPTTEHGVSFTSYELRLPGEDKIYNTDDDIIVRDGLVMKASDPSASAGLTRHNAP
jgi:type II secretory pathway pseudopilin PulG